MTSPFHTNVINSPSTAIEINVSLKRQKISDTLKAKVQNLLVDNSGKVVKIEKEREEGDGLYRQGLERLITMISFASVFQHRRLTNDGSQMRSFKRNV